MPKQIPYDHAQHQVLPPPQYSGMMQDVIPSDSPLQFEQRILRPSAYPVLDYRNPEGEGEIATHRMMNAEVGINGVQTPIAFPSVVFDPKTNKLMELNPDQAFEHAMKTGEFRSFETPQHASDYAEGLYKRHWGQGDAMDAFIRQLQQQKSAK